MWFDTVKGFYEAGMVGYDKEGIKIFVVAEMITEEEYKVITGDIYVKGLF